MTLTFRLDGKDARLIAFDPRTFQDFRHGYAGTIYKGQGRTLDQTYLYHSEHWRSASSYVALTRHRDKTELFVATNTAADLKTLSRQMARVDDRRAASAFYQQGPIQPVRPVSSQDLKPVELFGRLAVGVTTARYGTPFDTDSHVQQRGAIEPSPDSFRPRPRRDRADVGRDAPAGPTQDAAPRPAQGAVLAGWTEQAGLVAQQRSALTAAAKTARLSARRDRAEVSRGEPPAPQRQKPLSIIVDAVPPAPTPVTPDHHAPAPAAAGPAQEIAPTTAPKSRISVRAGSSPHPIATQTAPGRDPVRQPVSSPEAAHIPAELPAARPAPALEPDKAIPPAILPEARREVTTKPRISVRAGGQPSAPPEVSQTRRHDNRADRTQDQPTPLSEVTDKALRRVVVRDFGSRRSDEQEPENEPGSVHAVWQWRPRPR